MLINILDIDKFVSDNDWLQVKVSNYFIPNTSENHPDGLVSNVIFGSPGSEARKHNWGYLELNGIFMNPHVFYVLSRLKASLAEDMKSGLGLYYIDKNGELVKMVKSEVVPATALSDPGTGFKWLYNNWEKISWKTTKDMTKTAKIRRTFMKMLTLSEAFITKYPVMPAFYRDVDFRTQKRNELNTKYYSKMYHLSEMVRNTDDFQFSDDPDVPLASNAHIKMQNVIQEFYSFIMTKISGANGFINDHVVGKSTDYGARLVISTPNFNTEHYKLNETDFFHSSVPLAVVANIFAPFVIFGLTQYITNLISGRRAIYYFNFKEDRFVEVELDKTFMDEFTVDKIRKNLDLYKKSKNFRVTPVTLRGKDKSRIPLQVFYSYDETKKFMAFDTNPYTHYSEMNLKDKIRDITWCELFYLICQGSLRDKTVYNTRYPVTAYNSTYPSLMNIIPANKYIMAMVDGVTYERYPILKYNDNSEIEHLFTDTMRMFSVFPSAMGADFDGDQISTAGPFTDEANSDAIKHMNQISNVLGINGEIIREFPEVVNHGIYGITYKIKKPMAKE